MARTGNDKMDQLLKRLFLWLFVMVLLASCAKYSNRDDWQAFDHFKELDQKGFPVDCEALVRTTITKERFSRGRVVWKDNLVTYLYESGYTFSQCTAEIASFVDAYCEPMTGSVVDMALQRRRAAFPGELYLKTCSSHYRAALADISFRYSLPSEESPYISLEDNGVLLSPGSIFQVEFGEKVEGLLWFVTVATPEDEWTLFYGNKDQWEAAKAELATALAQA